MPAVDTRTFRRRVEIQKPRSADQVDFTDDANWIEHCVRYCVIKPTGGSEVLRGDQKVAVATHTVTLRADELTKQINPTYRLKWGARHLNIESVVNVDQGDRLLELKCRESVT